MAASPTRRRTIIMRAQQKPAVTARRCAKPRGEVLRTYVQTPANHNGDTPKQPVPFGETCPLRGNTAYRIAKPTPLQLSNHPSHLRPSATSADQKSAHPPVAHRSPWNFRIPATFPHLTQIPPSSVSSVSPWLIPMSATLAFNLLKVPTGTCLHLYLAARTCPHPAWSTELGARSNRQLTSCSLLPAPRYNPRSES
jgi:hypothetical protein